MHELQFLIIAVIILALVFDFINGFHDTANAIATSVSTRALKPRTAIIMAAFLNFFGAMYSTGVAKTIGGDIVKSAEHIDEHIIVAALIGAIVWNLFTWWIAMPSSSSHALVGGIIGAVIKKYYSLDLGTVVFGFNLIIILVGIVLFNVSIGLYTLINMYIVGEITNKVVAGFNRKKLVIIISPFSEIIGWTIIQHIGRGVTFLNGEGAYSHKNQKVIFAVVNLTQVSKVKLIVNAIDPTAFMIITDTSEVAGRGFTIKMPEKHSSKDLTE